MPGEPEKPRETKKDDSPKGEEEKEEDDHPMRSIEELKKDPNAVVHCELQDQLSKEFADKGMDFSKNKEDDKKEGGNSDNKESASTSSGNTAAASGGVTEGKAVPAA